MLSNIAIVLSGKKGSGKNTICNYIAAQYFVYCNKYRYNEIVSIGKNGQVFATSQYDAADMFIFDNYGARGIYSNDIGDADFNQLTEMGIKIFSFADALKNFCTDILGVEYHQVWGTQKQKEELTHLTWDGLPEEVMIAWSEEERGKKADSNITEFLNLYKNEYHIPSGHMSGRETMQVFGSDIIRKWYNDAWAEATYRIVNKWFSESEFNKLALICDGRFPNEMDIGLRNGAKTIRILRDPNNGEDNHISEIALDHYPLDKYSLIIDNRNMSIEEQNSFLKPYLYKWFEQIK